MANKDLTETRVRNVINQLPKSVTAKRAGRVRNTVRSTLSSMKSILGQLKQGNIDKLRQEKRRRRIIKIIFLSVAAAAVATALVIAGIKIFR